MLHYQTPLNLNLLNMRLHELNSIVDKYTEDIPSQVSLNLPKLKKVGSSENKELPKIKLPKLKKVTAEGASV